jgi:hypothetical protein
VNIAMAGGPSFEFSDKLLVFVLDRRPFVNIMYKTCYDLISISGLYSQYQLAS